MPNKKHTCFSREGRGLHFSPVAPAGLDELHEVEGPPGDGVRDDGPLPPAAGHQGGVGLDVAHRRRRQRRGRRGCRARDEKQPWVAGVPAKGGEGKVSQVERKFVLLESSAHLIRKCSFDQGTHI